MLAGGRNREFTGPTPHSVALRARQPSARPSDHLILERRKQEAARNGVVEFSRDQHDCDLKNRWERNTERKMVSATVGRRVQEAMGQYELSIDQRRDRLRAMLESEEEGLLREMEMKKDTVPERQAKMRERARHLQEKRERERQAVVADKLDQLFREQSAELRAAQTRRRQDEVCTERTAQIHTRHQQQLLRDQEETLFAQMWEGDRLAKVERQSLEARRQKENSCQQLEFLRAQIDAAERQRLQAEQLKEEEAQLLRDQREMMRLEEQREHAQKLQNQEDRRKQLDLSLRLKMRRLAREQQEELALDMNILEQLLAQTSDQRREDALRKLELREEQNRYRQYLEEQLEEQRRQESETEQLIEAELQHTLKRRAEQQRLEKEARDRLMKDVLDTRRLQIQEKLQRNAQKQAELAEERDELNRTIQANKLLDEQEKTRLREANQKHRAELLAQMFSQQQLRDAEQKEKDRVFQTELLDQKRYEQKVQDILSRPTSSTTVHPFRTRAPPTSGSNHAA